MSSKIGSIGLVLIVLFIMLGSGCISQDDMKETEFNGFTYPIHLLFNIFL